MESQLHEIGIRINIQNHHINFTYDPSTLHVHPGDEVKWVSTDGPFAIQFKKDTPTDRVDAHSNQGGEGAASTAATFETDPQEIRERARGHYHYAVAVSLRDARFGDFVGRVALDGGCPEIIVN